MGWFARSNGRRGLSWKDQVFESASAPPAPLIVFFGLVILLMVLASYADYKEQMQRTKLSAKLFVFLLPLLLMLMLYFMMVFRTIGTRFSSASSVVKRIGGGSNEGGSPLFMLFWVVLLLVMVHYQSSFQASWLRLF